MSQIIQIRDVPDEVHGRLVRRAEAEGLSLNRYLLDELERIARRNHNKEVFEEAAEWRRTYRGRVPTSEEIVESIRAMRDA